MIWLPATETGYLSVDKRYDETLKTARKILTKIIKMRKNYVDHKNEEKNKNERNKLKNTQKKVKESFWVLKTIFLKS